MRPVRVDLTWTTDANGNATVKIPFPFTGRWYNVKFSMTHSALAEWAVTVSGTPVTYGRGRRVTLGPELIQDGETVAITVSGGPPNEQGSGAMTGVAGEPEEVMSTFAPQPNTIAMDIAAQDQVIRSYPASGGTQSNDVPVPRNTISVGYSLTSGPGFTTQVNIIGKQTGIQYVAHNTGTGFSSTPFGVLLDPRDTLVTVSIVAAGGNSASIDFIAWAIPIDVFAQQRPGDVSQVDVTDRSARLVGVVQEGANPPLWQSPNKIPVALDTTIGAGGTTIFIAAVANQTVRIFDLPVTPTAVIQLQDTNANEFGSIAANVTFPGIMEGAAIGASGTGFQIKAPAGAASVNGLVSYSQG